MHACAIIELWLPGMNGLALQEAMGQRGLVKTIIVVTASGHVAGAFDFLKQPIDSDALRKSMRSAIAGEDRARLERAANARAALLLGTLARREREFYERIVRGRTTARSPQTSASTRALSKSTARA